MKVIQKKKIRLMIEILSLVMKVYIFNKNLNMSKCINLLLQIKMKYNLNKKTTKIIIHQLQPIHFKLKINYFPVEDLMI